MQISEAFIAAWDNIQVSVNTKGRAAGTNWRKRIMDRSWHSATSLAQSHGHSNGATIRLVGNKVPWTGVKSASPMTLAVVNSRKCETRKKSVYKTTGSSLHIDRPLNRLQVLTFLCFSPKDSSSWKEWIMGDLWKATHFFRQHKYIFFSLENKISAPPWGEGVRCPHPHR